MITINGITHQGSNITIINNKVMIDGKNVTPDSKEISIAINANVNNLEVDCCEKINITGDVSKIKSMNGSIFVTGNVNGDVDSTNGNVQCGNVKGSVKTTNGNIRHSK